MRREFPENLPRNQIQRKPLVSDPSMHRDTCVTHVPWCMSGSLTHSGGENVRGIPGAWASRNFTYLARGPLTNSAGPHMQISVSLCHIIKGTIRSNHPIIWLQPGNWQLQLIYGCSPGMNYHFTIACGREWIVICLNNCYFCTTKLDMNVIGDCGNVWLCVIICKTLIFHCPYIQTGP